MLFKLKHDPGVKSVFLRTLIEKALDDEVRVKADIWTRLRLKRT